MNVCIAAIVGGAEVGAFYGLLFVPFLLIHLTFAFCVLRDSKIQRDSGSGLFLFGPVMWSVVALFFGLFGVVAYWAIHHSSLRVPTPPAARRQ